MTPGAPCWQRQGFRRSCYLIGMWLLLGAGAWLLLTSSEPIHGAKAQILSWRSWDSLERWSWVRLDAVNETTPGWTLWSSTGGVWMPISVNENRLAVTVRRNFSGGKALEGRATLSCRLRQGARYRLVGSIDSRYATVWLHDAAGQAVCSQAGIELYNQPTKKFPLM